MRLEFEPNTLTPLFTETEVSQSIAGSTTTSDAIRQGVEAAQTGNRARARALFLRVTEAEPHNEEAWMQLASVSEYPEELVVFLSNVLEINPHNERAVEWMKATKSLLAKTFIERGIDAARTDRTDFARQCFYQAAAHDAKNEMSWLWLASVADTTEEKQTHLARVLAINPENLEAQTALAAERERNAQAMLRGASTQALSGDREAALAMLTEILSLSPRFENALALKAHLTDDLAAKIKCFEDVLEINPTNQAARAGLDSLNALRHFAVEVDPAPEAQDFAADFFYASDETEAVKDFAQAEDYNVSAVDAANEEFAVEETNSLAQTPETNETHFAPFDETVNSEEEDSENSILFDENEFRETTSDENMNFAAVSFQAFEEQEQSVQIAPPQNEIEATENIFDFETETSENISEFGDELFEDLAVENDFAATTSVTNDNFALTEPQMNVFTPNEMNAENDFALPAVEFPAETEISVEAFESLTEDSARTDFAEFSAAPESSFDEESQPSMENHFQDEAQANDEFYSETNQPEALMPENSFACPFCSAENDMQSFTCRSCLAVLSLSELEMLLANENVDRDALKHAVERMEEEKDADDYGEFELMSLGIGHINLKNFRRGLTFLQQASRTNPNNVVLSAQVNAFALRLEEIERREETADAPSPSRTILVVDDSATVRKLISGKLEKSGHEVFCAVDGMDALAKLEETAPDLILLDITMPRMDGYQVCKMIRGNPSTRNIPVVMISGKDGFFDKVRGRMAGTTGYITKPFGPETLMKALDIYIKNTHDQIVSAEA